MGGLDRPPEGLASFLSGWQRSGWVPNGCRGSGRCLLFEFELDRDGAAEYCVATGGIWPCFGRRSGEWALLGFLQSTVFPPPQLLLDELQRGGAAAVPHPYADVKVGEWTFQFNPTR